MIRGVFCEMVVSTVRKKAMGPYTPLSGSGEGCPCNASLLLSSLENELFTLPEFFVLFDSDQSECDSWSLKFHLHPSDGSNSIFSMEPSPLQIERGV